MFSKFPVISGKETISRLEKLEFTAVRQKGSHVVMRRGDRGCALLNRKSLIIRALSGLLKQAGVSINEFA
jgi:predicted RNA binding protein YcfA (HicA-like mRNA interferase family)